MRNKKFDMFVLTLIKLQIREEAPCRLWEMHFDILASSQSNVLSSTTGKKKQQAWLFLHQMIRF